MTAKGSMAALAWMEWVFASCNIERNASAAPVKCNQIPLMARSSPAACRCKQIPTFGPYHDTESRSSQERALRAGAFGYIMKENATDEVLRALRKVLAGELYFSERVAAAVVQRTLREKPSGSRSGIELLSDRELQVFQLLGAPAHERLLSNFTLAERPSRPTAKK